MPISFIQEPTGMNLNELAITLQIENVILDLISADQCTQIEVIFWCPIWTIGDIIDYTKLCKLARLEWMNEWIIICHAINSITGQSMDVKIIVTRRPWETSWLISGPPHMPIINQNNLMQSWTYIFVQLLQLVSFYNPSKKSVVSLASPTIVRVCY